jgi:hypothetical protein
VVAGKLGGTLLPSAGIWRGLDKPLAALGGILSGGVCATPHTARTSCVVA